MDDKFEGQEYAVVVEEATSIETGSISTINTKNTRIIINNELLGELEKCTAEHETVVAAVQAYLSSPGFNQLEECSKKQYLQPIREFIKYINEQDGVPLTLVSDFEAWDVRKRECKPQCSSARKIQTAFRKCAQYALLKGDQHRLLCDIVSHTRLSPDMDTDGNDISHWFSSRPWIREFMGDYYVLLASPKRIGRSFILTVAVLLKVLLEARRDFKNDPNLQELYREVLTGKTKSAPYLKKAAAFIGFLGSSNSENGESLLYQVITAECVKPAAWEDMTNAILAHGAVGPEKIRHATCNRMPFLRPRIFASDISQLEEMLAYWLCVYQTVQPTDAIKLTKGNFVVTRNHRGTPRTLQIKYYKGRSADLHETPVLTATDPVASALLLYIENLTDEHNQLFSKQPGNTFSNPLIRGQTTKSAILEFFTLLLHPRIAAHIDRATSDKKFGDLFVQAVSAMCQDHIPDFRYWKGSDTSKTYEEYCEMVEYPLPQTIFGAELIKNTAVYSRSDRYRDDDLVNSNSHTSLTEKLSYMTDTNMEWINQVGRVTRMVMDEIGSILSPAIQQIDIDAHAKRLATRVQNVTGSTDVRLRQDFLTPNLINVDDQAEIVVRDEPGTAIAMLHYLEQADKYAEALRNTNHDFFVKSVVVNVEWAHYCLSMFSSNTMKIASEKYERIKAVLPPLFKNELSSGI